MTCSSLGATGSGSWVGAGYREVLLVRGADSLPTDVGVGRSRRLDSSSPWFVQDLAFFDGAHDGEPNG